MQTMQTYFVHIQMGRYGGTRSLRFMADSFAHAEEQAKPYIQDDSEQIITIEKDYT